MTIKQKALALSTILQHILNKSGEVEFNPNNKAIIKALNEFDKISTSSDEAITKALAEIRNDKINNVLNE